MPDFVAVSEEASEGIGIRVARVTDSGCVRPKESGRVL